MFDEVDALKSKLDSLRPLPEYTVKSLHEQLVLDWTYHSNAIEGNTLTLKETKVVLEGISIGGKSMREHFEAINHRDAIAYVEAVVAGDETFSERVIKLIHQLVLKNVDEASAGVYRQQNVVISGAEHRPPDYLLVQDNMSGLMQWYDAFVGHPIERAIRLHVGFVKIHPFVDGNGRTARLLMNFELMKCGYLPIIIKAENRFEYYEALEVACVKQDYHVFLRQAIKLQVDSLSAVLSLVGNS